MVAENDAWCNFWWIFICNPIDMHIPWFHLVVLCYTMTKHGCGTEHEISVADCSAVKLIHRNICMLGFLGKAVSGCVGHYLRTCQTYPTWCVYYTCKTNCLDNIVMLIKIIIMFVQGVSKPMSQTVSGYSPPPIKQKSSYQHGSKSEQVPRYRLMFMCWYPFEYYIRCWKCWPFAATHPLRCRIMDSLTHSSWPGRFLMASNVATMRSHNSSTLVTGVE